MDFYAGENDSIRRVYFFLASILLFFLFFGR